MKKSTKFISLILAVVMVVSVIPITASGAAINTSTYNTVEKLISNDGLYSLISYLINNLNNVSDNAIGSVLRLVYIFMNNDDINALIGSKDITELTNAEAAKVLVNWLDTYILPDLSASLEDNSVIQIINDNVPGLTVKLGSVQEAYDTLAQLDGTAIKLILATNVLGDAKDLNVSAVKNVTVKNNELTAVKKLFKFVQDNLSVIRKALTGDLSLGVVDSFVGDYLEPISQLNLLLKSAIYKLIDSEAAVGKFGKGEMAGDWGNSAYASYTADQLLAAALIKLINKSDDVSLTEVNNALNLSFYGLLSTYGPKLYANFAVNWLNDNIQDLVDKLDDVDKDLRAQFKPTMPTFDESTFADIFNNASSEGFLGQLNNILVKIANLVLSTSTYNSLGLASGDNSNLNANLTKICRYALPLLFKVEDKMGYTFPDSIKANYATASLSDMAIYILKPFYATWFKNSSTAAVDSADSLADLAVLAVYYTATNDWMNLDYDFSAIGGEIFASSGKINNLSDDAATELVLRTAAGIGIGALRYNADKIHFNITVDDSNWEKAVNQISNWALDFIKGLPALVNVHDIRNQDDYGAFYKLNVLLNELINFSFLNNVSDATFKLDIYTLLTDALLGNLYNFDIEGVIAIFEKNDESDNILGNELVPSVIGIVNRIVTALFEHTCGTHGSKTETVAAEGSKQCTHTVTTTYDYCTVCGAYFSKTEKENKLSTPVHEYKTTETKQVNQTPTVSVCGVQTRTTRVCQKCGDTQVTTTTAAHKNTQTGSTAPTCVKSGTRTLTCSVCNYTQTINVPSQPATGKHTYVNGVCSVCGQKDTSGPSYSLGDVDADGSITAADARLALRCAVKLQNYAEGSAEFLASDIDKDKTVTAGDARIILRIAVNLESVDAYK